MAAQKHTTNWIIAIMALAVCLCLASELYEPEDYIYDYEEFLKYKGCSR